MLVDLVNRSGQVIIVEPSPKTCEMLLKQEGPSRQSGLGRLRITKLFYVVAILVTWQMVPGSHEILENAVHLIREGHLAHALPDAAHQENGPEHGCSGSAHFCECHSSASFLVAAVNCDDFVRDSEDNNFLSPIDANAAGHLRGVFFPPKA